MFLNVSAFSLKLSSLVCLLLRLAELFEAMYLTPYVQKIKQLATSFQISKFIQWGKGCILQRAEKLYMIHFLLLVMTSAATTLHFSFHLYITLYSFIMSQIVFRLLVTTGLWEIHCPGLETNMGLAENRIFLLFPFHFIHFIAEGMLMTNNY